MSASPTDLLQGTLDVLILKTLAGGPDARLGHLPADPAALAGRPPGQPGVPLSGTLPAGGEGLDPLGVGRLREQPPGAASTT